MSIRARVAARISRSWQTNGMRLNPVEDWIRSARDVGLGKRAEFLRLRKTPAYRAAYEKDLPLVSICIATYNRARLLRERSLRSCLEQTYPNIEIIVVGDACSDETPEVVAEIGDPRIRFENLAQRGSYPDDPRLRWMVAGTATLNHALSVAQGDFITHLDDDDEHAPERIETLLTFIRKTRADLVYHPFRYETAEGEWFINQADSFRIAKVTTSSIFYHHHFRNLRWDPLAYRYLEPGDWNRLRKIAFLGADVHRHPDILLMHYRERNQASS